MSCREKRGERATFRYSKLGGALNFDRIHDGANVVHPLIHGRLIGHAVGEAGATLIEKHNAAKVSKLAQPPRKTRIVPIVFDVGDETGRHNEVGTLAKYLIGDVYRHRSWRNAWWVA